MHKQADTAKHPPQLDEQAGCRCHLAALALGMLGMDPPRAGPLGSCPRMLIS